MFGCPILTSQPVVLSALALVVAHIIRRLVRDRIERKGYPLPPGPTPLPFFGSALSVNAREPFKTYTEWQAKYGDIMYIQLLGMDVVVLNSSTVAADLLERRSNIYSDRPFIETVDLYGNNFNFGLMRYGDHWRLCRRIFHQTFRADTVASFHPMQLHKSRQLVLSMMDDPSDYAFHYSTFGSSVAMCSIYDYDPKPHGDPVVSIVNDFTDAAFPALLPEKAALLKAFPFLPHVPDRLPGSSIKHEARLAREASIKMVEEPYKYARGRMESEDHCDTSMISNYVALLETYDEPYRSQHETALKQAASTAVLGSVDTTSTVLMTFTLAMVKNPRIWKRAQADIGAVVGTDRLPDFDDRPSLPYVDAIMRETLRWQPPTPVVPHATTASDIYNGFYIPKGATIIGNAWAMSRDEHRYPNPEEFIPERFLDEEGKLTNDMPMFAFGFGRRMCPGRHIAHASVWIAMATMLATLDFNPAKDGDGRDIDFEPLFANGITRHPLKFPCCITPREHINRGSLE